jgi:ADP-ribose pyrophosphatase YjhB (NUDIX family)
MVPAKGDITKTAADAKELLLEDYRYLAESFWKNEQTGETRVNWFIGIVTAASGGLIALATADHAPKGEFLRFIIVGSLFALVMFGAVTLLRVIKRNETTDGYKQDMDSIRQVFKDCFDSDHVLFRYQPFRPKAEEKKEEKEEDAKTRGLGWRECTVEAIKDLLYNGSTKDFARKMGGLAHTVALINCLLVSGLISAIILPSAVLLNEGIDVPMMRLWMTYVMALLAFVLTFSLQLGFLYRRDEQTGGKLKVGKTTHAGGIVYKLEDGVVNYLLVQPKGKPKEWLLPKGLIKKNEDHCETALRGVQEEAGVAARWLRLVGRAEFTIGKESVRVIRVKYYLMERLFEIDHQEKSRQLGWFTFEEAVKRVTHVNNKLLLHEAERQRAAHSSSGV